MTSVTVKTNKMSRKLLGLSDSKREISFSINETMCLNMSDERDAKVDFAGWGKFKKLTVLVAKRFGDDWFVVSIFDKDDEYKIYNSGAPQQ